MSRYRVNSSPSNKHPLPGRQRSAACSPYCWAQSWWTPQDTAQSILPTAPAPCQGGRQKQDVSTDTLLSKKNLWLVVGAASASPPNLILDASTTIFRLPPLPAAASPLSPVPANTGFCLFCHSLVQNKHKTLQYVWLIIGNLFHMIRLLLPGSLIIYSRDKCNILLTCDKLHLQAITKLIL